MLALSAASRRSGHDADRYAAQDDNDDSGAEEGRGQEDDAARAGRQAAGPNNGHGDGNPAGIRACGPGHPADGREPRPDPSAAVTAAASSGLCSGLAGLHAFGARGLVRVARF